MIHLVPMTESEFVSYLAVAVRSYAESHIKAGDVLPDEALALAQKDYDELLPDGLRSENQYLFTVTQDTIGPIGMIWYRIKEREAGKTAYLFDFVVREDLRGRGFGRQTLEIVERMLSELGVQKIGLNVFGYNVAARGLYEKMGYQITGIGMVKELGSSRI